MTAASVGERSPGIAYSEEASPLSSAKAILSERVKDYSARIFDAADVMGMQALIPRLIIQYNLDELTPNPRVKLQGNHVVMDLPFLFLVRAEDAAPDSEIYKLMKQRLSGHVLTEREQRDLIAFQKFVQNPRMAERAKTFTLYHELAHVLHGDILTCCGHTESCSREKRADLTAAEYSGDAEAGIYLFNILNMYSPITTRITHPLFQERVDYLSDYLVSKAAESLDALSLESDAIPATSGEMALATVLLPVATPETDATADLEGGDMGLNALFVQA